MGVRCHLLAERWNWNQVGPVRAMAARLLWACGRTVTHDGQGTKLTHAATDRVELGRAVERSIRASGWRLRTLATEGGPSGK